MIGALKSSTDNRVDDVSLLILPDLRTMDCKSRNKTGLLLIYPSSRQCVPFD
jgi:hypothetical protein